MSFIQIKYLTRHPQDIIESGQFLGRTGAVKRSMDIILSFCALIFLLPVFIVVALLVKLTSKGPVFFMNSRVGLDGETFLMYKFRSMYMDSENLLRARLETCAKSKASWDVYQKLENDPRLTRIGRLIRKTSLDELPQFLNVLFGTMSIVGPRPILSDQIGIYGQTAFEDYIRARPGITGLWQVNGRNNMSFQKRVRLDQLYSKKWSLTLDLKILLKTVPSILFPSGAF